MKNFFIVTIILISGVLGACQKQETPKASQQFQTITAALKSIPTQLFYSGTVNPVQIFNVSSPTDGTVKELHFKYGQKVNAGDTLLIISSSKLQQDYQTALTNYLKAAEDYNNAKINFQGTQELKKANIISDQEFLSDKQQYDNTALAFLSAKITLEQLIKKIPSAQRLDLEKLSIQDISTLSKILQVQYSDLVITANESGVALAPQKTGDGSGSSNGSDSDTSKNLTVGSQVKEGQALVAIGDLSGISTTVQVSELVINQIKPGQNVVVNLEALPNINFNGSVKTVGAQAQAAQEGQGGVASFPVTVIIPKISSAQMQLVRVGMTTKVQITIQNPPQIMIPITAVHQTGGTTMVTILGTNGQQRDIPVVTGQTSLDEVAIVQGLKPGDRVMIPPAQPTPTSTTNQQ